MGDSQESANPARVIAACAGTIALVLGGGAVAGSLGLELPEPATSMVRSLWLWP